MPPLHPKRAAMAGVSATSSTGPSTPVERSPCRDSRDPTERKAPRVRLVSDRPFHVVKSRKSARSCRNLNGLLCFHVAHGFIEIGFVRRIFAHPPRLIPVLLDAFCIDNVRSLETIVLAISRTERVIIRAPCSTHTWHILGIVGTLWRVPSMHSMCTVCGWTPG